MLAFGASAGPASAGELLSTTVSAPDAAKRSCILRELKGGRGVATRSVTAPAAGSVTARLKASSGDWDLAVFDKETGRRVNGSAFFGADEVANGLVAAGQRLTVQACRRSGGARTADLTVEARAVDPKATVEKASLVRVSTPTRDRKDELTALGLDLSEHAGKRYIDLVLHGADDAKTLRESKFMFTILTADLAAQAERDRVADRRFARASIRKSALPSGRDSYRTLEDYNNEMKQLVEGNPGLVKPVVLPFKTFEGRTVQGIEISNNVNARDGKPVFLQLSLHHAREWPSGEHAMEFAYELVKGSKAPGGAGDRVRSLLNRTRTIVIPVVNPDGFNHSRTRGIAAAEGPGGGRGAPNPGQEDELLNIASNPTGEYRRKNCRLANDSESGNCDAAFAAGLAATGVDPNRNYGGLWGGPGASELMVDEDYRGPGPFSEPETKNIRELVSNRHVTTLITNHTYSDLILRPPGVQSLGAPPDENQGYKALGDAMAAENGYLSQKGFELYDTTGTTEDWTYPTTGGFGFTFEIGCVTADEDDAGNRVGCDNGNFHPPYSEVVREYEGTTSRADETRDGKGNREAYLIALESTANQARHSVLDGKAPEGVILRLKKSFLTKTSPVIRDGEETDVIEFRDTLDTAMAVPSSSNYEWHINPSTRPAVAKSTGRVPSGDPSPKVEFIGAPGPTALPDPSDAKNNDPMFHNDHPFTVPANGPGVDNEKFTVRIQWQTLTTDWDARLFRDLNGNGMVDAGDPEVGTSQQGTTDFEQVTLSGGDLAGEYVFRVNNFAATEPYEGTVTFQGPDPFVPAQKENWTFTCEAPGGRVASSRQVLIDRGQRQTIDFGTACASVAPAVVPVQSGRTRRRCLTTRGGVRATSLGPVKLARKRARQRRVLRTATRLPSRAGIDRYCSSLNGTVRVGYPTRRLMARIGSRSRRRVAKKAILAISTDRRYRLRRVRVNSSVRTLRKRLRGEKRLRVGRNVWYTVGGKKSRLLFRTQRGKVRELGLGNKRLTASRRSTRLFLRAWDRRGL
ncbi:MAG: zinc carboxypeptidase [Thermoleophilaceae bacterium]|nr:zinc carboxypeptidase [Thermoleophilaceae bacterium]